jgi:DNA-binding NtrC family response regulator
VDTPFILIVDDTESSLFMLKLQLLEWGFGVITAASGPEALDRLKGNEKIDLVLSDQVMPEMDGIELLRAVKELDAERPFIMLTAHGSISNAVASIRKGADDYLEKPYSLEGLRAAIERSLSYSRLKRDHRELTDYLSALHGFPAIVTQSPLMHQVLDMARKVARTTDTTVTITGESGTGKELLARAIHIASGRMDSRFVAINCAAIPANLLESELFGHVKGAFTGADQDREGVFDLARQGSVLLDEIGDMPPDLQAKLLRALEERTYTRVGSATPISSDFRVIATSNKNLEEMVQAGMFRSDLYHRLSRFPITIPPLRERPEDIPLLIEHFLGKLRRELGKPLTGVSRPAQEALCNYGWPGNVRELKNCLERAAILTEGDLIRPAHLHFFPPGCPLPGRDDCISINCSFPVEEFSLDRLVDYTLELVLKHCQGNKSRAASLLKVDRKLFYRRG